MSTAYGLEDQNPYSRKDLLERAFSMAADKRADEREALSEVERLRQRLLAATPHDHSQMISPKRPIYGCPRCALEEEFGL